MGLLAAGIIITVIILILIPVLLCVTVYKKPEDRAKLKQDLVAEYEHMKKKETYKKAFDDSSAFGKRLKDKILKKKEEEKKNEKKDFDDIKKIPDTGNKLVDPDVHPNYETPVNHPGLAKYHVDSEPDKKSSSSSDKKHKQKQESSEEYGSESDESEKERTRKA